MSLCLQARQLACERDDRWLFQGLDLEVRSGEIVRIEGPNGSGKTSLLKILSGQLSDYQGELFWNGAAMNEAREHFLANLLYLGHAPGVKSGLSPLENLAWYQALSGEGGHEEQRLEALERVGLAGFEDVPAGQLSAGQQRRVALARLTLTPRALWVLDEPFTAIDRHGVADLEKQLVAHAQAGGLRAGNDTPRVNRFTVAQTDIPRVEEKGLHSSLHGTSNSSSQSSETNQQVLAVPLREHNGGLMTAVKATLMRDLTLMLRRRGEVLNPLVFFALVITLFPIAISPDPELLAVIAPGLLWVAALLAALLSLDSLFRSDYDDGSLEQLLLAPQPLVALSLAKVAVHWLLTGLPLALMAPILGIMLALPAGSYAVLALSLALGTASLSLIGAIGSALTVGLARGGVLLSLLVLPLYIPVLIFGAGAVQAAILGDGVSAHLAILGALLAASLMLAPWAIAASLRISING